MAFIDKKDPVVLNIKLTSYGRELLAEGNLNVKYFAIGDSETDYTFNDSISGYTPSNSNILRPADVNPNIISFVLQNSSGSTGNSYNSITGIPVAPYQVTNHANSIGFFSITTGGTKFITDLNHVKQPDAMIDMSSITGGNSLTLLKAPTYGTSGNEPAGGDLLLIKWTLNLDTTGYTINVNTPTPYLMYQISAITSGSLASGNVTVIVDRDLPDFNGYTPTGMAGAMIYHNPITYSGDTIFNYLPTDYLSPSVLDFFQNSQCPTIIFPFWNMTIIFTDEIAGVLNGSGYRKYGQFNSATYGGFVSYIQNQAKTKATYKNKLGVIHYTNSSPANVYGEGFYLNTPRLDIPTIMWHKSAGATLGLTLTAIGNSKVITGATSGSTSLNTKYYDLADPNGNIVGKVFTDLELFVIEDQELLFAMSYKSNRSWTLPSYVISANSIVGCI